MSRILQALEVCGDRKKQSAISPIDLRKKYGIPENTTAISVLDDLKRIDQTSTVHGVSSLKGVDLVFAAIDIIREEREPIAFPLTDRNIARPIVFKIGGAGLAGFNYGIERFVTNLEDIEIGDITLPEIEKVDQRMIFASHVTSSADTNRIEVIPQAIIDEFTLGSNIESSVAFAFLFNGSHDLSLRKSSSLASLV
jgi:hypothetical protein